MKAELVHQKAVQALAKQLATLGYKPIPQPFSDDRVDFEHIVSTQEKHILICTLNLSETYHVSIYPYSQPNAHTWVLLALYMNTMEPIYYLFPSMLFNEPGHVFARRKQSVWTIRIIRTHAIDALNGYPLCDVNDL